MIDLPQRGQQLRPRSVLEQIARGSGGEGVEDVVGVLVNGEHYELRFWQEWFQAADTFDAVHLGQVDVHKHHTGHFLGECRQGALTGAVVT